MSSEIFELKRKQYLEAAQAGKFADRFDKTHSAADIAKLKDTNETVKMAGRVVALRTMGKAAFAHLYDFSGKIQVYVRKDPETPELFDEFNGDVSIGDFIGVEGELFTTRTGELTINVKRFKLLNKCLHTLPEKFHGIEDIETRYRQRYLDLIMNPESRFVAEKRIHIVRSLRRYLEDNGFLEVETPVLQTTPSGALARPFFTHHNALDIECTLRIAPETYLKRLIGAGMDRVFEFARCFRNEGISAAHLQDFTMLEFYTAYWNWEDQRRFVTDMVRNLIKDVFGKEAAKAKGLYDDEMATLSWANVVDTLYKKNSRAKLVQPCYVVKYPAEMAPLARKNAEDPRFVDIFQFVVTGVELVKAYSELVDPLDQRQRLEEQASARLSGDDEAMPMDEDYLTAMEHGFPPIAGVGIGIDRLVTILCEQDNIKDAVLFPLMRPER
jgi:lysyl-tRNA synthetase class 2